MDNETSVGTSVPEGASSGADSGSPQDSGLSSGVSPGSGFAPSVPDAVQGLFDETFKGLDSARRENRPTPTPTPATPDSGVQAQAQPQPAPQVQEAPPPPAPQANPYEEQIQALGGWEQVQPAVEFVNKLYTPYVDQNGNPIYDPETRTQQITTTPALEHLRQNDPSTFNQMAFELLDLPQENGETVAHQVLREYFGVDPQALVLARQIQNGQVQASQYLPQQVSQEELEIIPQHLQETYKGLGDNQRRSLQGMVDDDARNHFLETQRQSQEQAKALQEVRNWQDQQEKYQQEQAVAQVETQAAQYAEETSNVLRQAVFADLQKAFTPFGPNHPDNERVINEIGRDVEIELMADPSTRLRIQQANQLALEVIRHSAAQDKVRAAQAQQRLTGDIVWIHATAMQKAKDHISWWSKILNVPRQAIQDRQNAAMGRKELATSGRTMAQGGSNGQPKPELAGKFTNESIEAIAQSLGFSSQSGPRN